MGTPDRAMIGGVRACVRACVQHIGGSTEEAQVNIAEEVSEKLITLLSQGSTLTAVNVPEVELGPPSPERHRVLHFHNNVPGVMAAINQAVGDLDVNIAAQYLKTDEHHGYIILDVERKNALALKTVIRSLPHTIWCRSLLRSSGKFGNDEDIHGGGL
jgi:D-3-phosphoglycerate dehydrogenase